MKNKIGIIYYGTGNIGSVYRTLKKFNCDIKIIKNSNDIDSCSKIILPGVGSFQTAMKSLSQSKLDKKISTFYKSGKNIFAICLGMQILFNKSSEDSQFKGLKILPGDVIKIKTKKLPLPHIGWNKIICKNKNKFENLLNNKFFYFTHSYTCMIRKKKINKYFFEYENKKYISALNNDNLYATQFHPELSGINGLNLLEYFVNKND
tara:strand:+ start:1854 stop:2471 length:618 start_codon:yes stop_codon:yes gene_type:complete